LSNAMTNVVLTALDSGHSAPAGNGYQVSWVNIPVPQIPAGAYSLIVQADSSNALVETNKANNVLVLPVTVTNLPPGITLLLPTNRLERESCVTVPFPLVAQVQPGSYTITNVLFYNNNLTNIIGSVTHAPYRTTSLALGFGTNIIGAAALDDFGLTGITTN